MMAAGSFKQVVNRKTLYPRNPIKKGASLNNDPAKRDFSSDTLRGGKFKYKQNGGSPLLAPVNDRL